MTQSEKELLKGEKGSTPVAEYANTLKRGEVLIGYIHGMTSGGKPEVNFHANQSIHTHEALTTIPVSIDLLGRNVVLSFVEGDLSRPIIMGLLWQQGSSAEVTDSRVTEDMPNQNQEPPVLGNIEVIQAKDRVELKCGKASITLTNAGKILLRGEFISSRSNGTHRIKGGSVQVN